MRALIAAACLGVFAPAAQAQFGGGFGGFGGSAGINSRNLEQYAEILRLTEEQRDVVQILFEEYMQETQDLSQERRSQMESMREAMRSGGGGGDFSRFRTVGEQFGKKRQALQDRLLGDVRVMLTEDQATQWPRLERAIRRDQSLRRGFLSGERVDLTRVVGQVDLSEEQLAEVETVLERYEVDLDRALVARDAAQTRAMEQAREVFRSGDAEAGEELFEKQRKMSARVRDLNRRYAREIEGLLADDHKARFQDSYKRSSFPQVYRPGRGQRVMELISAYEDLTEEQRDAIASIRETYERDVSKVNQQHAAAIEESEMSMTVRDMFRMRGRGGRDQGGGGRGNRGDRGDRGDRGGRGNRDAGPGAEFVQKKRELDAHTVETIQRLLSEAQAERLEDQLNEIRQREREQRGDRGRQFRRDR
ncbi:MAG: hypothetical protein IID31_00085 [Planctomycetes bacterium]|nr:hypothetical protein [Planctomycetota bacterium]